MANEVKVIGITNRWFIDQWYAPSACQAGWHVGVKGLDKDTTDGIELVDKAHVTRLQAEKDALSYELAGAQFEVRELTEERDDLKSELKATKRESERLDCLCGERFDEIALLQSELTKARELLAEALGSVHIDAGKCENTQIFKQTMKLAENIESFLAHQSAPATKDK